MKILIIGAGKMGSFFCDLLSFDHEVAIIDTDPHGFGSHSTPAASPRPTR